MDCRWVVNTALRKLGVLASGRDARPADAIDALDVLRGLYGSWIASGAFGRLHDVVPTGSSYVTQGNERIFRESKSSLEVTLPALVSTESYRDYGRERIGYYGTVVTVATDDVTGDATITVAPSQPIGYATPPSDGAAVVISDKIGGETRSWLYDGTSKRWEAVDDLTLDSEAPRSLGDPQGLAACLAMEISDQFSGTLNAITVQQAARYKSAIANGYGFDRQPVPGVYM